MSLTGAAGAVKKTRSVLSSVIFLLVGVFFIVCSVLALRAPKATWLETQGTVVEIQEDYDTVNEEIAYRVFVDYEVEGKTYTHAEYGAYNTGMKEGDTVTVQYNAEDPAKIQAPGSESIPYIVLGAGILAVAFGIFLLVRKK